MTARRCGICNSPDTKYKCPTCMAWSCSLPCFKQHKEACLGQETPQSTTIVSIQTSNVEQQPDTATEISNILASDLTSLFQTYPDLQAQLRDVYQATRDPGEVGGNLRGQNSRGMRRPWKPEKGFDDGLAALNRILRDESATSDAVAAFMKMLADKSVA